MLSLDEQEYGTFSSEYDAYLREKFELSHESSTFHLDEYMECPLVKAVFPESSLVKTVESLSSLGEVKDEVVTSLHLLTEIGIFNQMGEGAHQERYFFSCEQNSHTVRVLELSDVRSLRWRMRVQLKDKVPVKCVILQHGTGFLLTGGELLTRFKRTKLREALYYDHRERKELRFSPMQRSRSSHFGVVVLRENFRSSYCLGGYEGEHHQTSSSCESFEHTRSRFWKLLPNMLSRRASGSACSFVQENGLLLYVFGGVCEGVPLDSVERLVNAAWSLVPIKLSHALFKHATSQVSTEEVVLMGGIRAQFKEGFFGRERKDTESNEVYVLNVLSGKRYRLPEMIQGGALEGGQPCVMTGHLFVGMGSSRVAHLDVFEKKWEALSETG